MCQSRPSDQSHFTAENSGSLIDALQKVSELSENFTEDSRLNALAEDFNSRGIVGALNFAAHQSFNLLFVEQSQAVLRFYEWPGIYFVIRADNRGHSCRVPVDRCEAKSVAEFRVAFVVPT
jgi:hypothetical protein